MPKLTMTRLGLGSTTLLATAIAVACGQSNDAAGPSIPEDCEDLFEQGEFECTSPDICEYLEENPDRVARWRATLQVGGDHERELDCIERYLVAEGLDSVATFYEDSVAVEATYPEIETLCRAAVVSGCSATASSERCSPLDEQACTDEPLCTACTGYKLDPDQACFVQDAFAVCGDPTGGTQDWIVPYVGPDGTCWSGDCLDGQAGWTADPEAAYFPYLGGNDAPPICSG